MAQTTRHAHKTKSVKRQERHQETDDPAVECAFAPKLVQSEAGRFREPVTNRCKTTEDNAADDHVVEMRNQEYRVMQDEIRTRNRHQYARHTTYSKGD